MKRIAAKFLAVMAMAITTTASVFGQNGFSYQAVIRNAEGELITNKQVEVKFTLKHDGTNFYSEKQNVKTNEYGNIQVVVGNGEKIDGDFANVPWSSFDVKMEVAVDIDGKYITLGEVPVSGAPYAMYAQKAGGITSKNANTKDGDALFAVNDANGNPVFAVFADGIVVYVDDTPDTKAKRSGFVVTGREATKGNAATEYFSVTAEGTQIYVDEASDSKAMRSGFVVTGRSATKDGDSDSYRNDYLTVGGKGTTIYVDDDSSKAKRSGFVVTGRSATKGNDAPQYFSATADGTTVYVDDTSADKAKRSGFVVTGREATKGGEADNYLAVDGNGTQVFIDGMDSDKAKRSGFVVTGRSATKAEEDTLFAVEGGLTRVYVDEDADKAKRSGFVVTGRDASKTNNNIFNVSGAGNVDIKADFTVTDAVADTQEPDTAAVQPQPGDTTSTSEPATQKSKNLFTVSSGNVQLGTELVMMGDVAKKIEADTISVDSVEAEMPVIAKIVDRADTVSCAPYKPFIYGDTADNEGYTLLGIYFNGSLAKVTATDSRKNKVLLIDADGNVTKRQRNATVAVLMPEGDSLLYIRPLKATSQTISFGLMKKNATEPYQYIKIEAEIEASAGVPYKVVTSSTEGGHVAIDGTVAYGDQPTFEPVPNTGYKFVRWSDGSTRAKRNFTIVDDFEISAEFERISYVVTVKSDNELFGTTSGEGTYLHGDTANIEATPFTGYYFKNWSGTELNDSLQNCSSLALEITAKLKLIAHFGIMQYTITFDTDGGSEVAAITQDYNTKITAPTDPQKEGFRFRGWSDTVPSRMPAENLTLKAIWGINKYFITFNTDGGTPVDTLMYDFDEQVTAPEKNPTKEGFTFVGWDAEFPSTMPAKDLEFKAIWKVNRYALTWDANGGLLGNGLETDTDSLNFGDSIIAPVMARKGFWFYGWNDSVPATMPAKHLTYTALWDTMSYTIIYKNVDDDYSGKKSYDVTDTFDIKMPEKQGYEFVGWTGTNLKDTTKEITIKNDTGDIELTAIWASATMFYTVEHLQADMSGVHSMQAAIDTLTGKTDSLTEAVAKEFKGFEAQEFDQETIEPEDYATVVVIFYNRKSYELTWDANGGTIDGKSDSIQNRLFGDQIIGLDPVRPGYIFKGWNGMEDGYMDMPANNLTLVAKWKSDIVQYKVKHLREDLDGKFTIAEYDTLKGKTDSLTAAAARTFEGFTAQSFSQTAIAADSSTIVEILYNRNNYHLTWNANGGKMGNGSATMIDTIAYGDSVLMPAMAREGYTFTGWSDTLATMPAKDTTLLAQWKINLYTLLFKYSEDSVCQTITQDYNTKVVLPQEPTKTGYTFIGWSDTLTNIPAVDTTIINAMWKLNSYQISTSANDSKFGTVEITDGTLVDNGYAYGSEIELTATAETYYHFVKWSDDNTDNPRYVTVKGEASFEAIFEPDIFTVTYDPNIGSATGSMATQQFVYDEGQKLTPNAFAAGDYTFAGWATSADGDRVYTDSAVAYFSANTTLYAIWVKAVIACDQQTFWNDSTLCVSALFARSNNAEFTPGDEPIKWQLKLTNFAGDTVLATSDSSKLTIPDTTELVEGKQYLLNARMVYDGKLNLNADLVVTATESAPQTVEPTSFFFIDEKNGNYRNNGLTASSPFNNIDSALMRMNNASTNYTLCINGTLTGAQALDTWLNGKAKSITLCGLNGSDTLYGGFSADHRGTVLSIATSVPVTVKKLTITGGYAVENGGGIYVDAEANLTIASGTSIVNDTAFYSGGGIYTKGNCTMTGGRICNNVITFNGATFGGGVSADWDGKFTLQNGEISYNEGAYYGGGVVTLNGGTFEMTGGEISYNEGAYYGGGVATYDGGTFEMTGGEIVYNSADFGGGVYNGSSFTLSGGTISGNSSSTGSGLYIPSGSVSTLKDNAAVNKDNVVYLATEGSQITIAGELTADTVAVIKPYSYKSRKVLTRADGTAEDLIATQNDRFVVEKDGNGNLWSINDEGYLMQVADVDAIVNQIENMTESGTIAIEGYLDESGVNRIKDALGTLHNNGSTVGVTLDFRNAIGFTLPRDAFNNTSDSYDNLEGILLPESITEIPTQAFWLCHNLKNLHIPSTVTNIVGSAFYRCGKLNNVTLAEGNTAFKMGDDKALYSADGKKIVLYCDKQSEAVFEVPAEVEEICDYAFGGGGRNDTKSIKGIIFDQNSKLKSIGNNAFDCCTSLSSIEIPDSVSTIGKDAFLDCGMTSIKLPSSLKVLTHSCLNGNLLTTITIPEGVEEIEYAVFWWMSTLTTVDLPASMKNIAEDAFANCTALTTVNYHGTPADSANINIQDSTIIGKKVVWNFDYALYVSPKGSNSNSGTSADAPLQSLDSAFAKIVRNTATNYNYIINIDGTLRGPQAMGDSLNNRAASITLIGANGLKDGIPQDSLAMSDGENARVLTIGTSTPIIIKNLAITGGRTVEEEDNGGGIYVLENANASLTIADGALIADNRTNESGGGIYVGSGNRSIAITGGCITNNEAYSCGGGVYVSDCQFTTTGGSICRNVAESGGGAYLFTQESTIGGKALISYNRAMNGGGLFICSGISDRATVRLTDFAKITNDTAYTSGGGVCVGYGIALAMNGFAEISGNIAGTEGGERGAGGGVYLDYDEFLSTFNMTGGTIAGNNVLGSYTEGAGVYVNVRNFGESCQFGMGGNAVIAADNDVYLPVMEMDGEYYNAPIIIMGDLTGETPVATITLSQYIDSLPVLATDYYFSESLGENTIAPQTAVYENYLKFAISNDDYTLGFNGELRPATIVDEKKYAVYEIETSSQLSELIDTLNASPVNCTEGICISIANDLTLENHLPYDGDKDDYHRAFKGVFDGNGHTLTVKSFSQNIKPVSLVCVNNRGIIQNMKLEFVNDTTFTITEIYGTAQGIYGGFCFYNYEDGIIRNCWNAASVHVKLLGRTGGICGGNSGLIENCLNTARLSAQWNKTSWNGRYGCIGGICGQNCGPGIVRNCVNYGEVYMPTYYFSGENDSGSINGMPGAICGTNEGVESIVENCYFRDSCLYCNRYSNEAVLPTNNMIYPAKSVRKGIVSGCGYFVIDSVNTTAALYAGNYDNCSSNQTLADYAEGDLLKALNGYVNAQSNPSLKPWKKENGKHAAVLNFGE